MAIGLGLIGTGFMGKVHALAYRAARAVFGDLPEARLACLCDTPAEKAEAMANQFGFEAATDDWRALVARSDVDIVSITTPNGMHREMALAAIMGHSDPKTTSRFYVHRNRMNLPTPPVVGLGG